MTDKDKTILRIPFPIIYVLLIVGCISSFLINTVLGIFISLLSVLSATYYSIAYFKLKEFSKNAKNNIRNT